MWTTTWAALTALYRRGDADRRAELIGTELTLPLDQGERLGASLRCASNIALGLRTGERLPNVRLSLEFVAAG